MSTSTNPAEKKEIKTFYKESENPNDPNPKFSIKIEDLEPNDASVIKCLDLQRNIQLWYDQPWSKPYFYPPQESNSKEGQQFLFNLLNYFKVRDTLLKDYMKWKIDWEHDNLLNPGNDLMYGENGENFNPLTDFPAGVATDILKWNPNTKSYDAIIKYHPQEAKLIPHSQFLIENNNQEFQCFWGGEDKTRPFCCLSVAAPASTKKQEQALLGDDEVCCAGTGMIDTGCPLCCVQETIWKELNVPFQEAPHHNPYQPDGILLIAGILTPCKVLYTKKTSDDGFFTVPNHNFAAMNVWSSSLAKQIGLLIERKKTDQPEIPKTESLNSSETAFVFNEDTLEVTNNVPALYMPQGIKEDLTLKNYQELNETKLKLQNDEIQIAHLKEISSKNEELLKKDIAHLKEISSKNEELLKKEIAHLKEISERNKETIALLKSELAEKTKNSTDS